MNIIGNLGVIDIILLICIAFGAVIGFKEGVIKKTTDFLGLFLIVIIAFYLKNDLSVIMYENLPFFNFGGFIKGVDVLNVLMYELLAFFIILSVLVLILRGALIITGIIEKILKATIILSIPSKLLGIFVGAIEAYVYIFLILVVINLPLFNIPYVKESKVANFILNNTPVLSKVSEEMLDIYGSVHEILKTKDSKTNEELNEDVLKLLLDKQVITKDSAKKLVDKNKIHINNKNIVE